MGRPDVPQAQHHGMSEVQAEGMSGDKAHGRRKRPAPAAQRPQHEPRRKDVDQKVGAQRGCAERGEHMVCQQHAERREQPHRHAHTERAALPFLMQAQPDAARIEQRPAEKEADQRKRRVKHQHAVRLTRDQQLHAERRGRRAQHQPPRISLHRDTEEIRQQDELHKDEYVIQMDIRAAGQQVEKRMGVRHAAQRLENADQRKYGGSTRDRRRRTAVQPCGSNFPSASAPA